MTNKAHRAPQVFHVTTIKQWSTDMLVTRGDGTYRWVPCRPLAYATVVDRVRLAWRVFTGRYDALDWDNDSK